MHDAGAIGRAKESPRAWPDDRRCHDCDVNYGMATRSLTQTPVAEDFVAVGGLCLLSQ